MLGDWEGVRSQFDFTREYIHLAALLLASHPRPVREAIEMHRRAFDQNPVHYLHQNDERFTTAVVRAAAAYLGVDGTQIALTDSTTMGLGLLYNGLEVRAGQEILTTTHDHSVTHRSLRFKATRSGATVRMVPLYRDLAAATEEEIVDTIRRNVTARTRILAVTFVHSSTGLKLPIRKIADAVTELNAGRAAADRIIFCVDGVHGFGVEDLTFPGLGCDFFVAGTHKWIFGPRGTGLVCGKPDAWAQFTPTIPSFGQGIGGPGTEATPGGYHSFEMRWALAPAFQFHMAIGKARVAARIHELATRCKDGLAALPKVRLYTPRATNLSAGIVCFDVQGLRPAEVVDRLEARKIIASTTPYTPSYARVTPGLLNTPEEVDRAVAAIAAL
jgi:isopenicillin-N epimerase